MNPEKLKKLQEQVRMGGKGTPRRKKKVLHAKAECDEELLQSFLKKLSLRSVHGIKGVNIHKDDGSVIHFKNPLVQASPTANSVVIMGHGMSLPSPGLKQPKPQASSLTRSTCAGRAAVKKDEVSKEEVPSYKENLPKP